jgi:hypothetical protein
MGILDFLFKAKKRMSTNPKCSTCGLTNEQILHNYKSKGILPIGNAIGVCHQCERAYCNVHSVKSAAGLKDNLCPRCKTELNFYWDSKKDEPRKRAEPLEGLDESLMNDENRIVDYVTRNLREHWQVKDFMEKISSPELLVRLTNNSHRGVAMAASSIIRRKTFNKVGGEWEVNDALVKMLVDSNHQLLCDIYPFLNIISDYHKAPEQWCNDMLAKRDFKTLMKVFKKDFDIPHEFVTAVRTTAIKALINSKFDLQNDLLKHISEDEIEDVSVIVIFNVNFSSMADEFYRHLSADAKRKSKGLIDVISFLDDYKANEVFRNWYIENIIGRNYRGAASTWNSFDKVGEELNSGRIDGAEYHKRLEEWRKRIRLCKSFLLAVGTDAVDGVIEELGMNGDCAQALSEILVSIGDERAVPVIKKLLKEGYYDASSGHHGHDWYVDFVNKHSTEKFKHKYD